MGTTSDAIRSQTGIELAYVLCIEGYEYLITDMTDLSAVTTAWASTIWSQALTGLQVSGDLRQTLRPWSNEPSVQTITCSVVGDTGTDRFAKDIFKSKPSVRSEMTLGFDTSDSTGGSFTITLKKASDFAANEPVFIGNERFETTGTHTGTTVSVAANGMGYMAPFSTDTESANRFPGPHRTAAVANVNNVEVNAPVYVTDSPPTWIGKKMGLWVHRVVDGVLDVKAQAELWFAGTIASITEGDMSTDLECVSIQQSIIDAEILNDQWVGRLKEGYVFATGDAVKVQYIKQSTSPFVTYQSDWFTAGTDFTAGRYTAEEFGSLLAEHLDTDGEVGVSQNPPNLRWSAGMTDTENGPRFMIAASEQAGTSLESAIRLFSNNVAILEFLGFEDIGGNDDDAKRYVTSRGSVDDSQWSLISASAPYRYPTLGRVGIGHTGVTQIEIEDSDGTFFDQTSLLPQQVQEYVDGDTWALYSLGSMLFVGRRASATSITGITFDIGLPGIMLNPEESMRGLRIGDPKTLQVKQCLFITDTFCNVIAKLFASIDGNGVNHATYDVFPFGAGIPWELLGNDFLNSLLRLEQAGSEDSIALIVEKPTKLWDLLKSDFALRMAAPVWKDQGIQIAQLRVPNATTADHTLDETNKGDARRTTPTQTSEFLTHTLKIKYDRNPITDKYLDEYIVRDQTAYESAGKAGKTKTIKARNSYGAVLGTGSSVEALGDMLGSRFMPILARPLKLWTRSYNHQLFHMAPGDTVSLSDDRVRNPLTGEKGISSRACTVLSTSHSLGISSGGQGYHGEVELLYTEEDRAGFPLAPSAEQADITSGSFTNGYDSVAKEVLVYQSKFSDAADPNDSASFETGDAIRLTAIDPANPASASTHTDTIASITEDAVTNYDAIELTTGFTPAAGVMYYVTYDAYDQVDAAQKLHTFQADDSDGEILDTIDPNLCGDDVKMSATSTATLTHLPARYAAEQYGDGEPLSASFVRDQIRMANNLANYKTAPHMPLADDGGGFVVDVLGSSGYYLLYIFPFPIDPALWLGGRQRKLNIAPQFSSDDGTTATVRITSSASPPTDGPDSTLLDPVWYGPKKHATFTTTSTTANTLVASQELEIVRSVQDIGMTWITIEADKAVIFQGVPEFWLGPLQ